jgi:hypothetical protein
LQIFLGLGRVVGEEQELAALLQQAVDEAVGAGNEIVVVQMTPSMSQMTFFFMKSPCGARAGTGHPSVCLFNRLWFLCRHYKAL